MTSNTKLYVVVMSIILCCRRLLAAGCSGQPHTASQVVPCGGASRSGLQAPLCRHLSLQVRFTMVWQASHTLSHIQEISQVLQRDIGFFCLPETVKTYSTCQIKGNLIISVSGDYSTVFGYMNAE